jgi:hypothetical protein
MLKYFLSFLKPKTKQVYIAKPMDFSHAISLQISIKKDGNKEYRPFGYSSKKGTPITTITYEE